MSIYDIAPSSTSKLNGWAASGTPTLANNGILSFLNNPSQSIYALPVSGTGGLGINLGMNSQSGLGSLSRQPNGPTGFFGNGRDLGFNFETAQLGMGALNGIFNLWGANEQRKAIKAQIDFARENMAMQKHAYDSQVARRAMIAAGAGGATQEQTAQAGLRSLDLFGSNNKDLRSSLLSRAGLAPAKREEQEPVRTV